MSFELHVQPIKFEIEMPSPADIENGSNALLLRITTGMLFPTQPGQPPMVLPFGLIKFPIPREQAEGLAEGLKEAAKDLPKASQLVTANNLEGVDRVANFASKLKDHPPRKR